MYHDTQKKLKNQALADSLIKAGRDKINATIAEIESMLAYLIKITAEENENASGIFSKEEIESVRQYLRSLGR